MYSTNIAGVPVRSQALCHGLGMQWGRWERNIAFNLGRRVLLTSKGRVAYWTLWDRLHSGVKKLAVFEATLPVTSKPNHTRCFLIQVWWLHKGVMIQWLVYIFSNIPVFYSSKEQPLKAEEKKSGKVHKRATIAGWGILFKGREFMILLFSVWPGAWKVEVVFVCLCIYFWFQLSKYVSALTASSFSSDAPLTFHVSLFSFESPLPASPSSPLVCAKHPNVPYLRHRSLIK